MAKFRGTRPGAIMDVYVDAGHLERMLHGLDIAVSPMSLAQFLTVEEAPYLSERAQSRFDREGDEVVGAWAPLKPATEAIRAARGFSPSHPINKRTGQLEAYITNYGGTFGVPTGAGAILSFPDRNPPTGELRDKLDTAQRGRDNPRTVPRPVLGVGVNDLEWTLVALTAHISTLATHIAGTP